VIRARNKAAYLICESLRHTCKEAFCPESSHVTRKDTESNGTSGVMRSIDVDGA
jgi:hypothetical protein